MNKYSELAKPFPESAIHWRVGATNAKKNGGKATKGIALAYLNARDVMERLDLIVGCGNWQDRYPYRGCCELGIRVDDEWIWRADAAGETDVEGIKGQSSDSFKRAAVKFGVGRYLYGLPNEWYDLTGQPWNPFATKPKLPQWATPAGWDRIPADVKKEVYEQTLGALSDGDDSALKEVWDEFNSDEHIQLWSLFDSKQRQSIKSLKGE